MSYGFCVIAILAVTIVYIILHSYSKESFIAEVRGFRTSVASTLSHSAMGDMCKATL